MIEVAGEMELNYDGHKGKAEYSKEDGIWHGRIIGIRDIVTFEASNIFDVKEEFVMAVDDWIETRKSLPKSLEDVSDVLAKGRSKDNIFNT